MCAFASAFSERRLAKGRYEFRAAQSFVECIDPLLIERRPVASRTEPELAGRKEMNAEYVISAAIAAMLLGYLVYALLKPERF
jgi:K+-transporting ATPase KdpF subunit